MSSTGVFPGSAKIAAVKFTSADSANTKKTLITSPTGGSKVAAVIITSTDTSDRVAQLWFTDAGATAYLMGSVPVPDLSGTDGVNETVDALSLMAGLPKDVNGQVYLLLEATDLLQVSMTQALTAAKEVHVTVVYGDLA